MSITTIHSMIFIKYWDIYDFIINLFHNYRYIQMKNWQIFSLSLITLSALLLVNQNQTSVQSQAFQDWKQEFSQSFQTEEDVYRKLIFMKNLEEIERHNSDKTQTYTKGLNQFTHLSSVEFSGMFLNRFYEMSNEQVEKVQKVQISSSPILKEIDWQAIGKVNNVVGNQGLCDAGYAFCSAGLIQSYYLMRNVNVSLSKQQIVDCSADYTTFGCQSGSRNGTLIYIRAKGLTAEKNYAWKGVKNNCQISTDGQYKPNYTHVEFSGCSAIQNGLYGSPLTVAVSAKNWQTYKAGIYNGCTTTEVDHDILLIGFNNDYWRLKNSWGVTWGEYGYIRLFPGNTCGICEKPGFGFKA